MTTQLHRAVLGALPGVDPANVKIVIARPEHGDLAVGCFFAKAQGKNPAQVAQELAAAFTPNAWLESATAAGPFLNFRANRTAGFRALVGDAMHGDLVPKLGAGKTICID